MKNSITSLKKNNVPRIVNKADVDNHSSLNPACKLEVLHNNLNQLESLLDQAGLLTIEVQKVTNVKKRISSSFKVPDSQW